MKAQNDDTNTLTEEQKIWALLQEVKDPEIPVLSVIDLGIVRSVSIDDKINIVITPTYSGCPAMDVIGMNIRMALAGRGFRVVAMSRFGYLRTPLPGAPQQ